MKLNQEEPRSEHKARNFLIKNIGSIHIDNAGIISAEINFSVNFIFIYLAF